MEKIKFTEVPEKIPSGYDCIDNLMQGGIEPSIITEFYGMGGAGKTNLSMIFSYSMVKSGRQVIYIDTEGFSVERFKQICGDDFNYNDINIYRVKSLDDQHLAVIKAEKLIAEKRDSRKSIGLMVVDSFTNFFRMETGTDANARMEGYERQLNILSGIAIKYEIPVLITNQIYADVENHKIEPFGGYFIDHAMKAIYYIEKMDNGNRRITVIKHRSIQENLFSEFKITKNGISCQV
ncbi:DNA repair protein RadB [Acidiplasma aeolicum]|uniref:DNA repair and recombination protein RadB n=1 Tax=Acidiplasma aeolicum TaxID=507754 RepID=A0A0P9CXC8_9ARCH|nr:DNA repair and recombination protein RadB [Acidiplasma aeolicum]KPV47643.1 DNA repair protein RadB [Acidiplasma aeolicum]